MSVRANAALNGAANAHKYTDTLKPKNIYMHQKGRSSGLVYF